MSERQPELETVDSKREKIQSEILDLYHMLANIEFDTSAPASVDSSLDDLAVSYTSRIVELEAELAKI